MITAVGAIVHSTSQRNELVRFYREKLGLGDPDHTRGQQFFRLGDVRLGVEGSDARLRGPLPRTGLYFVVDDLEAQVSHMKSLGVPFDVEPQDSGGTRVAVCRDPDGNFVTLMAGPRLPGHRVAPARPPRSRAKAGKGKKKKR
ncbi:MAG TPA: VOC family protein [Myxococcales bacterium]|nr:VOC family protein [Myxococcales bacterium]